MPKKFLFVAALLCGIYISPAAQEVRMDVDALLRHVALHNAEVRSARSSYESARQEVAVARAARLPQVNASLDLNYIADGTILDRDFSHPMRDKLPHFGNTLSVTLYQPLYHGGSISAGIDLARSRSDMARLGITRALDAVSIEALGAYFNLLKMQNLRRVYQENISITQRLIDQMTEHYNQGTALRNDITRYNLRLSSLNYDLQCIDNSISVLTTDLSSLLGLEAGSHVLPETDILTIPDIRTEEYWQDLTSSQSIELKSIDTAMDITRTGLKLERAAMRPSVGLIIADRLSGPVTFEIPAINKNYNAPFAGVSFSYNLSSLWTANKKVKQKKLEINHMTDQRTSVAESLYRRVHEAYVASVQARQMLDTENVNVELANENYSVVVTRFNNDMALLTDMLDASTAKLDAETRLVNARINLLLSFYQLKFISGTLTSHE